MMDKDYLYQIDIREWIERGLDADIMVPVSGNKIDKKYDIYLQSFLLPLNEVENDMENDTYNAHTLMPGITVYGSWEDDEKVYHRWGNDNGYEPLVIKREYNGVATDSIEIVEEFRLLFNLYFNSQKNEYIDVSNGEGITVVKMNDNGYVTIHKRYLKTYLAVKEKVLMIHIDSRCVSIDKSEKIKERPVNKKKLLRRTLITASMAVIFGLVACFTFLVLEPVISNWLYPEEEPQVVVFPEDQDEMSPEQMLTENMQQENQNNQSSSVSGEVMEQEQIRELLSGIILDLDNYKQIYNALAQYVAEMNRSMVTVTGVSSGVDWFNNVNESKNQSSGVIIAQNGKQLLILTDYSPVKQADDIIVTFNEGTQADASLKEKDETTGLAVIAVELDTLNEDFLKNDITIATFGSSNIKDIAGLPVVALGRPMGTNGSLGYGIITSSASESAASDTTYRILQTNIVGSQNAGGVLFNLQGQVIGIITNGKSATDMKNMVCAYGITELKRHIEKMSNGEKFAYLGLKGVDVTEEANSELGVPYGAYIKEVEMDSPAMLAGIQQGDVITGFGERVIISFDEYTNSLLSMKPGDSVELTIMRQSQQEYKEMKFDITLTVLK